MSLRNVFLLNVLSEYKNMRRDFARLLVRQGLVLVTNLNFKKPNNPI